ncbi:MAG: glycosyl hydrolase family 32 [Kiritimatiellae bacterium]|nr:glycosyl hydrolase family 32 [Kiritimatiellia bacterium]
MLTLFALFCAPSIYATAPTLEVILRDGGTCESDVFEPGARLFSDRTYTLAEAPPSLKGKLFLRTGIAGMRVRCVTPGKITALTPPEVPQATSLAASLTASGFERVTDPQSFQLFGKNAHECVNLYRKELKAGETLRLGKWCILVGFAQATGKAYVKKPWAENEGEQLYNGIVLPEEWPPQDVDTKSDEPMPVPYLSALPKVIRIDVGRQLFVDEFLIESTDLLHMYHLPEKYAGNPVLHCETALERQSGIIGGTCRPCIWWNPLKQNFYLWYQAGAYFKGTIALATSKDGLHWDRPELDVNPGSNQALPLGFQPDSYGIVADWEANDPQQRFKLFSTHPGCKPPASSFTSADGIHWINKTETGPTGDRSSMFYNPFRKKWVYSLRTSFRGRSRNYWECDDFLAGAKWSSSETAPWLAADRLDAPEPGYKHKTQLYNFDAVAYESIMLGFFELHRGPDNGRCARMGLPKLNEISFGYSRDGFHFSRPDRRPQIPASRKDTWDRGFIEGGGNICAVVGDKLYFYHSGCCGDMDGAIRPDGSVNGHSMYDPNAIGISVLRRDGFASLNAGASMGVITTRPVIFSGKRLFVNVDCPQGELKVEILDEKNRVIEPFSRGNCTPVSTDSTIVPVVWSKTDNLTELIGKPVRFRFSLRRGSLYAFWVSRDSTGRSDGYVAGGGPGYTGSTDTTGAHPKEQK